MEKNVINTDLSGKVAVVTGAGGVLCSAFAKVLARAGAKVALLDLNEAAAEKYAAEIREEGGIAKAYGCKCVAFTYNDPIIFFEYAIASEDNPIESNNSLLLFTLNFFSNAFK